MAVVKISRQLIQPNPLEVDYWVDIAANPYGGVIKYYNGYDWVTFDGYTVGEINDLLAKKADIEQLNEKADRSELSEFINNIELKTSTNDVHLAYFKYDGTNIAITFPKANEQSAGVITAEQYNDFVKQHQLQDLYIFLEGELSKFAETIDELKTKANTALDTSYRFAEVAQDAKVTAQAAKNSIASLEGLTNVDTSALLTAEIVTKVEQNVLDIQYMKQNEVVLPESEFDALETKDPTKKYYIYEDE